MPNRMLRSELLESEAWLSLKDNADRAAWIACFLTVDNFGDMPAGPLRLVRLWNPYGIDSPPKAAKVLSELCDADLVRRYEVDSKPYLHIPRFKQRCRFFKCLWPLSPWASDDEKQAVARKSPALLRGIPVTADRMLHEVEVEVEVEEKHKDLVAINRDPPLSKASKPKNHAKTKAILRTIPPDFAISDRVRSWAAEKGHNRLDERFEHFAGYARRSGKKYLDWDEAFMSAVRENWAKLAETPTDRDYI